MARQTSGQQIPPKGTTRQKISKTSPSKREIHGFLTDRITRFPCQNMKLCKLGTGRRVSRRQGTKHPQKGRPDRSCPPTFACESLPGARPAPGCQTTFACESLPGAKTRAAGSLSHAKVSQGARPAPDCPPTFACESLPGAKTRAADSLSHAKVSRGQDLPRAARPLSHAKVSPGGSTSPFLEIGLDQIRDVGIEWNLQFIAQDRHALMDRFWQSQRDCLALRVDPGPSPGRHSPIPPERMGFFLCWRRVRLHAAIEQS